MSRYATIDLAATAIEGKVTLNGVLLWTPAFAAMDIWSLNDDADVRGRSVVIPGANGNKPKPRRRTATRKDLGLIVVGGVNRFGAEIAAGPRQGLIDNVAYLRTNLGVGLQTGDGTVTLSWQQPSGTTLTEPVTVEQVRRGPTLPGFCCRVVVSMEVPAGIIS